MKLYTTGEIARICHVTPHTVAKWFDSGLLKGFLEPRSRSRRIPHDQLLSFMQSNGLLEFLPIPKESYQIGVIGVTSSQTLGDELVKAFSASTAYTLAITNNTFDVLRFLEEVGAYFIAADILLGRQLGNLQKSLAGRARVGLGGVWASAESCGPAAQVFVAQELGLPVFCLPDDQELLFQTIEKLRV